MNALKLSAALALVLTSACYDVQPMVTSTPAVGTRLALSINDTGRLALGGTMGPEIRRVEGNLLNRENNEYVLAVTGVNLLNGDFQKWDGETVRIQANMVNGLYERKFSKGRTIAFVGLVALAAATIKVPWVKSQLDGDPHPEPPPVQTSRRPVGFQLRFSR
jgi:hypothetical protein